MVLEAYRTAAVTDQGRVSLAHVLPTKKLTHDAGDYVLRSSLYDTLRRL